MAENTKRRIVSLCLASTNRVEPIDLHTISTLAVNHSVIFPSEMHFFTFDSTWKPWKQRVKALSGNQLFKTDEETVEE